MSFHITPNTSKINMLISHIRIVKTCKLHTHTHTHTYTHTNTHTHTHTLTFFYILCTNSNFLCLCSPQTNAYRQTHTHTHILFHPDETDPHTHCVFCHFPTAQCNRRTEDEADTEQCERVKRSRTVPRSGERQLM